MSQEELEKLDDVTGAIRAIAAAVYPPGALPGHDATGGTIASLTEAVMGINAGLIQVANSLESIATAIRERND